MAKDTIKVILDSNEIGHSGSGKGLDRVEAFKLAIAARSDHLFEGPFKSNDQIVDVRFVQGDKSVYCELKREKDLIGSWKDERLGKQAMDMASTGCKSFFLVLGSDAGVLSAWPKTSARGDLTQDERVRGWRALMSYINSLEADTGVPVHFRSVDPIGQCLSIAKHLLNPNEMLSIPKRSFKRMAGLGYPVYMLSRGPGMGEDSALALIRRYGSIHRLNKAAEEDIDDVLDTKIKGRKIGKRVRPTFEMVGAI